ncbi:ABC transporter substrate-binding protein [uncultured Clostridium sp.]|uniref:ABC transporter substrate-binding protein n=1 Tax=uncultured Clostridium sp. TaxID=59620 RepID=UPI0025F9A98D|nr:ABC transporter substrate-binding protein [uncultured Clostridium sp.]MDU4884474.1 ABC transporter substrate-binding protein [Clostridium celatum]MDU7077643.1 ABC transporter substrate-binding protein [Clostridium celatum]
MKRKIILPLIVATTIALALAGCTKTTTTTKESESTTTTNEQAVSYPISLEVSDNEGNKYTETFNEAPTKVITNNQSSLELLLRLGLQDSIIGTIALDNEIPEELKDAFSNINVITESKTEPAKEVIVGMSPDLVIGRAATFIEDKYGTIESLNSMNINVYTQLASLMNGEQSLDNIFEDIKNVGKIFNVEDKANDLATELSESLKSVKDKVSTVEGEPLKVLVMTAYNDGSYNVFGANSTLQNEVLEVLGGTNVNEKGGAQSLENLMSLNPDVILYVYNNKNLETDSVAVESLYNNSLIQSVSAIENKKVFEVSYTEFMGYGYRTIECIENLAKEMYPDLFN